MTSDPFTPETLVAVRAVRDALATATAGRGRAQDATSKGLRDVVTATDVAVEDGLRETAERELGIPLVGEERGGTAPAGTPYWLVDPLCGTGNYAAGIPLYCVNLAVVVDGEITAAVVGDASTGEVLAAERGRGAWAMDSHGKALRRLTTSRTNEAVVIEAGRAKGERRAQAARFTAAVIAEDRWDVMALNSTLSLAYVAAGRVAAYVLFPRATLHVAAGSLLATEAGATVTDLAGVPWTLESDSLVAAADEALHRELLALHGTGDGE